VVNRAKGWRSVPFLSPLLATTVHISHLNLHLSHQYADGGHDRASDYQIATRSVITTRQSPVPNPFPPGMLPFTALLLRSYYRAIGWNEDNSYSQLTRASSCE
jgi:hypothetical protein